MTLTSTVGTVTVGNVTYSNAWAPKGVHLIQVNCVLCLDEGVVTEDDGAKTKCDCKRGWTPDPENPDYAA